MRMNSVAVVVELGPAVALKSCKPKSYLLPLFKDPFLCDIYAPRNRERTEREREREREREGGREGGTFAQVINHLYTSCFKASVGSYLGTACRTQG